MSSCAPRSESTDIQESQSRFQKKYTHIPLVVLTPFSHGINFVRFPSTFRDEDSELIMNGTQAIGVGFDFEEVIDTARFIDSTIIEEEETKLLYYSHEKENLLSLSKNEFSLAAKAHFSLEDIYSSAMNFKETDKIAEKIKSEIENII